MKISKNARGKAADQPSWQEPNSLAAAFPLAKNLAVIDGFLCRASGYQFYNTSKFTFEKLLTDPENIEANFRDYLAGFSNNVQDVLSKFDFDNVIKRMVESNTLYLVIKEFASPKGYLGPDKIGAVDCGYIFEDLVRRFSESFGQEAGAHFTSRDIIYLMTDLLLSDADLSQAGNVTVYEKTLPTLIQTNETYESTQIDAFFESKPKIDAFLKIDANAQRQEYKMAS